VYPAIGPVVQAVGSDRGEVVNGKKQRISLAPGPRRAWRAELRYYPKSATQTSQSREVSVLGQTLT
jgi:hypothetical protein